MLSTDASNRIAERFSGSGIYLHHECRPTRVPDFKRSRVVDVPCADAWRAPYVPPEFRLPCGALTGRGRLLVAMTTDDEGPEAA